jgi:murein hydrolase activator
MERVVRIFVFGAVAGMLCLNAFGGVLQEKQSELERIKKLVEQRKKDLDEYEKRQKDLNRYLDFIKKQKDQARELKGELDRKLTITDNKISQNEERRLAILSVLQKWISIFNQRMKIFFMAKKNEFVLFGSDDFRRQLLLGRILYRGYALSGGMQKNAIEIDGDVKSLKNSKQLLAEQTNRIQEENRERDEKYNAKKMDLENTEREYEKAKKEMDDLNLSAKEILSFLEKYSTTKKEDATKEFSAGQIEKNSMSWPADGKVIGKFGKEYISSLKTWVFRKGIKISADDGAKVKSAYLGRVIYVGPFRSYGNIVILDHGNDFFSIYGFLKDIFVAAGDVVKTGTMIATAGEDVQDSANKNATVYFEIRMDTKAVNPMDWLQNRR